MECQECAVKVPFGEPFVGEARLCMECYDFFIQMIREQREDSK